jgi:putative mRNA 3-end processing factor
MNSITGLGGCREVGRSAFLLDFGEKFLFDYGVKLNPIGIEYPLDIRENIKAAIISHAHLDHSGFLPYFYKHSECLSFMTQPTLELADILWADSIKIAEFEGMAPKYTRAEIDRTHKYNFVVPYKRKINLSEEVSLEFFDAGHILGSAITKLVRGDQSFIYTGDFKLSETQLHIGADMSMGKADYVMIESTYGDREHPNRKEVEKALCESVQDTVDKGGWAIVPAFAVGRSQEIVDILTKYNITTDIYLDGMGKKVADLYIKHSGLIKDSKGLKRGLKQVKWIRGPGDRKKAMKKPSVIVTTSGMMKGGPVIGYVQKIINDPRSKIHLSGYQGAETPGRMLQTEGKLPYGPDEAIVKVNCKYEKFDLSAHPGQSEMITSLKKWSPKKIFLVHGDDYVMPTFAKKIKEELGIDTEILELGSKVLFE